MILVIISDLKVSPDMDGGLTNNYS